MKNGLIIIIIFLLSSIYSNAQFVNFGQDRPSLKWKQIKTNDFQLIYPEFFETNAQKVANMLMQLYRHSNTLQQHPKKISVILHADGGVSNGNVALAPRKSEFYTMPPQEPDNNWLEQLCIHEFRHVVQFDKVNQGLTKGLYYLFGEIFPIAVVGIYIPMWFMEGDAVCSETAIGQLGRGRSPEFLNEMKAQIVEKGIYSFPKAILGSYVDFVPNRYNMGYFMTANARINYGPDIWAKALERTGRRPFGITPFSKSLQLTMRGKRDSLWRDSAFQSLFINPDSVKQANTFPDAKRTLYRDNFSELQQIWKKEIAGKTNLFDTIPTWNRYYTNYYSPIPDEQGGIIAYKKGIRQTGAFIRLQGQKEELLVRTGILYDYKFTYKDGRIFWSEYHPHIRWDQASRMRLCSYDIQKKKYKHYRSRYNRFSPFTIEENIGCVEVNNRNQAFIVILDSSLKHEIARFPAAEGELFIHPAYRNGQITTVVQSHQGIRLESIDLHTQERRLLTENIYYELDNPQPLDSTLIYRASYNGNNAFYKLTEQGPEQILEGRFGIRYPVIDTAQQQLYFSFYTSDGYKPGRQSLSALQSKKTEYNRFTLADSMKKQENWQLLLTTDSLYTSRKYNKFTHMINIHSWGPIAADLNDMEIDLGAVVYSQNKLSTFSFMAGYALKSGFDHGNWLFNASYRGWWPVIDLNLENGRYDYSLVGSKTIHKDTVSFLYVKNKERRTSADIVLRLPFNLSVKQYNRSVQPYFRYKIVNNYHRRPQTFLYVSTDNKMWGFPVDIRNHPTLSTLYKSYFYQCLEYGISFSNQTRMTDQETNPRWGQTLSAGYTHTPFGKMNLGNQWWVDGRLYFPGFAVNHSISAYGGFQHMADKDRNYSNKILNPRGISLYGYEISSLRTTYKLPLLFPDQHLSSVLYFKSVEAGLFYDLGTSRNTLRKTTYSSYGLELTTDTHFFRLTYPIHMGFRAGYETQHKRMFANLIFSIGLSI